MTQKVAGFKSASRQLATGKFLCWPSSIWIGKDQAAKGEGWASSFECCSQDTEGL